MQQLFVNEGHTIGVEIALDADFTDDADFGFAIGLERAENQFLLGNDPQPMVAKKRMMAKEM